MKEFGSQNILKPQLFTDEEEIRAIKNTMTLDWHFGHQKIVKDFASAFGICKPWIQEHVDYLSSISNQQLDIDVAKATPQSLLMSPIMLTGECNANCEVCYTDRSKKLNELRWSEIKNIIDQTTALGSRTVYIAGEGEPTLDSSLFKIFDYAKLKRIDVLLFTNGLLLSNDTMCRERLGMDSKELTKRIADAPVYVYHKFWSSDSEKNRILMGLPKGRACEYTKFKINNRFSIQIPKGLKLLLDYLPRERVGIETCVERRTADEISEVIIPFIEYTGIKSYIEPLIHSGKNFNIHKYDPTPSQLVKLQPYLVRQNCTRVAYIFAVHNNGYATPGISILTEHLRLVERYEELNIRNSDGSIKDLFVLRHTHPFLVKSRYKIAGCLCEEFNLEMAKQLQKKLCPI